MIISGTAEFSIELIFSFIDVFRIIGEMIVRIYNGLDYASISDVTRETSLLGNDFIELSQNFAEKFFFDDTKKIVKADGTAIKLKFFFDKFL